MALKGTIAHSSQGTGLYQSFRCPTASARVRGRLTPGCLRSMPTLAMAQLCLRQNRSTFQKLQGSVRLEPPRSLSGGSRHPQGNSGGEHLTAPVPLQGRGAAKESTEKGLWKHWLGAVWFGGLLSQLSWPRKPGTQIALYLERASEIPREPGKTSLTFGCRERSSLSGCWPALATKHSEVPVGSQCPAPTQKPGSTGSPPSAQADILASS